MRRKIEPVCSPNSTVLQPISSEASSAALFEKLTDVRDKVNQLIAAGKINNDPTVGTTGKNLVDDANEAIACVQAAVAQSGITCPL